MRKLIYLLVFLVSGCAHFSEQVRLNQRLAENKSVVMVVVKATVSDNILQVSVPQRWSGTGFSIGETEDHGSTIITNLHVCAAKDKAEYSLIDYRGHRSPAQFVRNAHGADLCMLTTNAQIEPVTLAKQDAVKGQEVSCVGAPLSMLPNFTEGNIAGYIWADMKDDESPETAHETHFRAQATSVPIYPGNSGSPCFNNSGKVIGVVFAMNTRADHITYIVPVNELHKFLDTSQDVYDINSMN